ncbi:hypothetical protein N431DRAFT_433394 [Stipitochalara longipes BDJ]|nr:hypothetical protein N431DRAFT_433394 [Stipitochalara longipes BDJ]
MVGVPGRSKACKTCKKRKIACTLERPSCKICIKSNRECLGYEQDRTFILDSRTKKQLLKVETKEVAPITPPDTPDSLTDSTQALTQIQGSISTKNAYSSLWTINCPSTRSVYRQQIICEFLYSFSANTLQPRTLIPKAKNDNWKSWFSMLPSHPNFTTALEATILAICTAKLGRVHNDPALVHESLKFYVQGLWELQKALYSPELMYKDETAASCMALIAYEVMECPDKTIKAWVKHVNGCATLFQARGPEAYSSEFGHELFLAFRQMEIQQALSEKRKTFLSDPEWNELPWKGFAKSVPHRLLDLQAEMTVVLATGNELLSTQQGIENPLSLLPQILALVADAWKLDTRLNAFYKRLARSTSRPIYWARLSNGFNQSITAEGVNGEDGAVVFPVAYQFESLDMARTCTVYWASLAILWSGMKFVYSLLSPVASFLPLLAPGSSLPPLEHRSDTTYLAKNICQSIEYIETQSPASGPMLVVFPLKVAIETMADSVAAGDGCVKELEWAKALITRIGRGAKLLNNLDMPVERHVFIPSPDKDPQEVRVV